MSQRSTRSAAIAAGVAMAGLLGGTWWATRSSEDAFAACRAGAVAGDIGGPFELVTGAGATVTDRDVITKPSLVYFGYTFCPDVCPFDMARTAEAVELLAERGMEVTPVFITIDPERDTPDVVADFAANLHDDMIGLTGTPDQIRDAARAYRAYYKAHTAEDEFYLVDHSTFTYLVFPDTGFADFFRNTVSAQEMADRVACFVENT